MAFQSILLLDDDEVFRTALSERLESEAAFQVTTAGTISEVEAYLVAKVARFDAMLLDVHLPDGKGWDLCSRLRTRGLSMPILMLTGADGEADVIRGLDAGANDYVVKPLRPGVLLARLRSQLRAWENHADAVLTIGQYGFQPSSRTLHDASGKRHAVLTNIEASILCYLHRRPGQLVTREDLLAKVWNYTPGLSTHTVETHIYRLRLKLEQDPAKPCLLLTQSRGCYGLRRVVRLV